LIVCNVQLHGGAQKTLQQGLSVVDPARAMTNSAPALVHIDGLSADGNPVKKTV
jgi:hypothetical protein